jgi:hypothetical protein
VTPSHSRQLLVVAVAAAVVAVAELPVAERLRLVEHPRLAAVVVAVAARVAAEVAVVAVDWRRSLVR